MTPRARVWAPMVKARHGSAGRVVKAEVIGVEGMHREQVSMVPVTGGRRGTVIPLVAEVVCHVKGTAGRVLGCAGAGLQGRDLSGDSHQEPVPEA